MHRLHEIPKPSTNNMKSLPYFISQNKITLIRNGEPVSIDVTSEDFDSLQNAIFKNDWKQVEFILENPTPTGDYSIGDDEVKISDDTITFNGEQLEHALVYRLKEMQKKGLKNPNPWLHFISKIMKNPSQRIRDNLHSFVEDRHMALTEEGNILAYKGVREDYMDIYSGTICNIPGNTIQVPRPDVDDNPEHTCSNGLHVGDYDYARSWGSNGKLLLIEFDPADAVSVPIDGQKLRVCRYKVLQEIAHNQPLQSPLYQVDPQNQVHPMSHKHPSYTAARDDVVNNLETRENSPSYEWEPQYTISQLMDKYYGLSRKDVGRICTELQASLKWNETINDFVIT